jgi:hypothetical protein
MARRRAFAIAIIFVAGLWPASATAHDHRPPRVHMLTGSERQRAAGPLYTWSEKQGKFCSGEHADGYPGYPRAADYTIGDRVRIRFRKQHKPTDVDIRQYRELNRFGGPKGDGRWKFFTLARVIVNGNVRWEARFDINRPGHHYFDVNGYWRDVDGCGGQSAYWTTHLKAERN